MNCLMTSWHQHEAELRGWLRHRLGNAADAEYLLQDVFIKAMRQGERFCTIVNARAWLYKVARNALADRLRLARDLIELPENLSAVTEETAPVDSLAACLPRVLAQLSPEDREAITLCDLERLSQEEYERLKGLSLPGAKSRVQRGALLIASVPLTDEMWRPLSEGELLAVRHCEVLATRLPVPG